MWTLGGFKKTINYISKQISCKSVVWNLISHLVKDFIRILPNGGGGGGGGGSRWHDMPYIFNQLQVFVG